MKLFLFLSQHIKYTKAGAKWDLLKNVITNAIII